MKIKNITFFCGTFQKRGEQSDRIVLQPKPKRELKSLNDLWDMNSIVLDKVFESGHYRLRQ